MIKKKNTYNSVPTVTIGISALNEEANISEWIKSVLNQEERDIKIRKIIIHSDGSTDQTTKIAKSFGDKRIRVYSHKQRKGKSLRLNQIFREINTDFLVLSDADVVFANSNAVRNLVKPFKLQGVMVVGGNIIPIKARTFTEKAVSCTFQAYYPLRKELRSGNNMFSATGGLMAIRNKFAKMITIPRKCFGNDRFIYFECLSRGYKYKFVSNAIVKFRLPQTLRDQIMQNSRFLATKKELEEYFDKDLLVKEHSVPKIFMMSTFLKVFLAHPVYSLYIYIVNLYCMYIAKKRGSEFNEMWERVATTKGSLT